MFEFCTSILISFHTASIVWRIVENNKRGTYFTRQHPSSEKCYFKKFWSLPYFLNLQLVFYKKTGLARKQQWIFRITHPFSSSCRLPMKKWLNEVYFLFCFQYKVVHVLFKKEHWYLNKKVKTLWNERIVLSLSKRFLVFYAVKK